MERFLTRLAKSSYKEKFILKGGTLLAKYIHLGRETQDLDFFIQKLSNTEQSLRTVLQAICDVDADDSFSFEVAKIKILDHSQLAYTGAEITLQALFSLYEKVKTKAMNQAQWLLFFKELEKNQSERLSYW